VKLLSKAFPTEIWEVDMSMSRLEKVSRNELMDIYKAINPKRHIFRKGAPRSHDSSLDGEDSSDDCEKYESDEFKCFNEQFYLSPPEYAMKIIGICCKLVEIEKRYLLRYIGLDSVTICSLNFALKTLLQLKEELIFNESDQTVIKKNLILLLFLSIKNLMKCDDEPMDLIYTQILSIIQTDGDIEITCGLIICLLDILREYCTEKSSKKIFNQFTQTDHQIVVQKMQNISSDNQLLHCLQRQLIINIKSIKKLINGQQSNVKEKLETSHDNKSHHHSGTMSHCIFERLLINSVIHIKSFKQLLIVLKHLMNGICCCNANIDTIKVFLRSTTIPSAFLKFIEKRIMRIVFEGAKTDICITCREKLESGSFRHEYIDLIKSQIDRRNGRELHHLYYHLIIVQKFMPKHFLKDLMVNIIVPAFKNEKRKFFMDPDNNRESMDICCFCLQLINESVTIQTIMSDILTEELIYDLKDCTLVPAMSITSCMILRHGLEYLANKVNDKTDFSQKIKSILFTNTHSLISELLDIYNEIGLPKISYQSEPKASTSDACGFEIVDEHNLLIRENLSKMDILFLSSVHWNILCDLIAKHRSFKADFLANICNNFNEDILFSIAYHAINTTLLRRDISTNVISTAVNNCQNDENNNLEVNSRCDYLTPVIIINEYDINYDFIISRSYKLFEICQKFIDKLQADVCDENPLCMVYSTARDKNVMFKIAAIHRDNFLSESALEDALKNHCPLDIKDHKDNDIYSYQHWFHQFKASIGVFESKNFRDAITKFVNRFIRPEDELEEIYRLNAIKEITNTIGIKYLSSIAKSCFEICFRLWKNQKHCK